MHTIGYSNAPAHLDQSAAPNMRQYLVQLKPLVQNTHVILPALLAAHPQYALHDVVRRDAVNVLELLVVGLEVHPLREPPREDGMLRDQVCDA